MTEFKISSQAALDGLEVLRNYIKTDKKAQEQITLFNKMFQCAVNQDDVGHENTHQWENFWLFLDVVQFPHFDYDNMSHIPEDAVEWVKKSTLAEIFTSDKSLPDILDDLFRKTNLFLYSFEPNCRTIIEFQDFSEFLNADVKKQDQVKKLIFSIKCYNEKYDVPYLKLLHTFANTLQDSKNREFVLSDDFDDLWAFLDHSQGNEGVFTTFVNHVKEVISEIKQKHDDTECSQKLIQYVQEITPTP